jgi:hypothetical protein
MKQEAQHETKPSTHSKRALLFLRQFKIFKTFFGRALCDFLDLICMLCSLCHLLSLVTGSQTIAGMAASVLAKQQSANFNKILVGENRTRIYRPCAMLVKMPFQISCDLELKG